ncbi:hypothetical protein E0L36_17735 [Streptomyces sp. AJS327]|uniref:hypothetical protein n=1 Tax=Streptomyces sp. AJS327 TaxID=2545265 RepID=UPI0015DDAEAF|nr:hypothetical protein [Streptomyces sp. AJS327]MBA0052658.1 hypothetical protein [Streptomyces sp. AJS327]
MSGRETPGTDADRAQRAADRRAADRGAGRADGATDPPARTPGIPAGGSAEGPEPGPAAASSGRSAEPGPDAGGLDEADLDETDFDEAYFDEENAGFPRGTPGSGNGPPHRIYAPGGMVNLGFVDGGQHVNNDGEGSAGGRRGHALDGPLFAEEILAAGEGFAEPDWFPEALRYLDSRLLILTGAAGTGRRTAALNLLHRHSTSMVLRAVDTPDLTSWRPHDDSVRGYLVDGLSQPQQLLRGGLVNQLIARLREKEARMVLVLPDVPGLVRDLNRELPGHVVSCVPPSTRALFAARFEAELPDEEQRDRVLTALGRERIDELLERELSPAHVAELVDEVARENADFASIVERLSFLAEEEVPELIERLGGQPSALAFLLAACVFEGLDYRVIQEEADRLLELADERLDATIPGTRQQEEARDNPRFVFDEPMDDQLRGIGARRLPREVHATWGYAYAVEPVRFVRHGRAEAVLRHMWRQYGQLPGLMTDWLQKARRERELSAPIGRVMGLAASWGGGRRALSHISALAKSPESGTRQVAAIAMGIAARDPVLAGEIGYRLSRWSYAKGWQPRATAAYTCGTEYGVSRPDRALALLGQLMHGRDDDSVTHVTSAIHDAVRQLFTSGHQTVVILRLSEWAEEGGRRGEVALASFALLLLDIPWFAEQLRSGTDAAEHVVGLVHRALNEREHFDLVCRTVLAWRQLADGDEPSREALETLLSALSHGMRHGVLRLLVSIEEDEHDSPVGKDIARRTLAAWHDGRSAPTGGDTETRTDRQRSGTP